MVKRAKRAKARKKKHGAATQTRRGSSGAGFDFEDQVAAWLLLKILTGQPLPCIEGRGIRLQMQTNSLGWLLDDILLVAEVAPDDQRKLAISCKSNVQVTPSGLPADFVERVWTQWSRRESGPFRPGKDAIMLATRLHLVAFEATWKVIKSLAPGSDVAFALAQIRATAKQRKVFGSVKTPAATAGITVTDDEVVGIIKSIEVSALGFDVDGSAAENLAIAEARSLLADNTLDEGRRMWLELTKRAKETRLSTGTLDIADLRRDLRKSFLLKDHPDYEASWVRLRALTNDCKAGIETVLPNGVALERQDVKANLITKIARAPVCVIYGDSGAGKSALVSTALKEHWPRAVQVWLGPEHLEAALSELKRATLGLAYPLPEILDASVHAENILVIDAAEHLSRECGLLARKLVEELLSRNSTADPLPWRVIIIGQTVAWENGELQKLAGTAPPASHEVPLLSSRDVKSALRSSEGLGWLASQDDAVNALTNARTLGWVVQAAPKFQEQAALGPVSLIAIADRLWSHWTNNKTASQRLLMTLAERDAAFEHSFEIIGLDAADADAFDSLPDECPLILDPKTNRIRFEHDLAADWARFQRLKSIASNTAEWARYATNPLWNGALRMLGQFLLRRSSGSRSAWDVALEEAEKARDAMPLANDILFDALFLDPAADALLEARVDMLFADNARRLVRLLKRFDHVASVPGIDVGTVGAMPDLSLYLEAQYRTPIVSRWLLLGRFLSRHKVKLAALTSPIVATLCERWLTSVPVVLSSGGPVPFRKDFAEIALASARVLQLEIAKGVVHHRGEETRIYQAAFAGATDLPNEVSQWALEMAQRRPLRSDLVQEVRAHRKEQAEAHKKRLEQDATYRERYKTPLSGAGLMMSRRKLPPWPLGPCRLVDKKFRDAVLRSGMFQTVMRSAPASAGEVLLSVIIEDAPDERCGSRSFDDGWGIAFDHAGYPTAYWKSPFYSFLRINADEALGSLLKLISFCTDRWEAEVKGEETPPRIELRLTDGSVRAYRGNFTVFKWSQENSSCAGQLHSALAAVERWLCDLIEGGVDVTPFIEKLLLNSDSMKWSRLFGQIFRFDEWIVCRG